MESSSSRSTADRVATGLHYRPGDPVLVRVIQRERRISVTDGGAAVERAGRAPGWRNTAGQVARDLVVNVSRNGVVSLPVVAAGPGVEEIIRRIGAASLALYQELLELHLVAR